MIFKMRKMCLIMKPRFPSLKIVKKFPPTITGERIILPDPYKGNDTKAFIINTLYTLTHGL